MGKQDDGKKLFSRRIKKGAVSVLVSEIETGGHAGSYRVQGLLDGKHKVFGVYKNRVKALTIGEDKAEELAGKDKSLAALTDEQKEIVREVITGGITLAQVRQLSAQRAKRSATVSDVMAAWLDHRLERHDFSVTHERELRFVKKRLADYLGPDRLFWDVTTSDLDGWLVSLGVGSKRFKNVRGNLSGAWRWAVAQGYAVENVAAGIEIPTIKAKHGGHAVLTPPQLATLLHAVDESFLPWLAISAFAGLRVSEICGADGRRGDRLVWEDFDWREGVIIVRPETAKTNTARHVPICSALVEWLEPWRESSGFVHLGRYPNNPLRKGEPSQTQRLGELLGGKWPSNCLRASRASYRLAQTNDLSLTALEGGHTMAMLRRHYLNSRFKRDAVDWFGMTPAAVSKLIKDKVIKFG